MSDQDEVSDQAKVSGQDEVSDQAEVSGQAEVSDQAKVLGPEGRFSDADDTREGHKKVQRYTFF